MGKLTRCVGRGRVGQSTQQCPQGGQGPDSEQDMEQLSAKWSASPQSRWSLGTLSPLEILGLPLGACILSWEVFTLNNLDTIFNRSLKRLRTIIS